MYEIKILDNKDFDRIALSDRRYSEVDESNLGFADREKNVAYVRNTHVNDLNKYLVNHELEELVDSESAHEDKNGIRHKKGPKIFKDIILPGLSMGMIQPEAPKRAAAQTQWVEGVGNVPVGDLPMYQGGGGMGGMTPSFGSYSPSIMNMFGSGASAAPVSNAQFGSYQPSISLGSGIGGTSDSSGMGSLPAEVQALLKQQMSGNYSGRISF